MSSSENGHAESKIDLIQIINLILSVYVVTALCYETFFPVSKEISDLLDKIDILVCAFFLYDFFARFIAAESKLEFLKWGWIDFISSIPVLPIFGSARLFRIIRILRLLRGFRSTKTLVRFVYRKRSHGVLSTVVVIAMLLTIFLSIAILNFEKAPNSNIKGAGDALWWAASTITAAGYGDRYPVTPEGRIVAIFLMVAGVVLFGTFTGFVASFFNEKEEEGSERAIAALTDEIRLLRLKVEALEPLNLAQSKQALNQAGSPLLEESRAITVSD